MSVPTSAGNVTIPQLGSVLTLNGRDSKFHVTDYDVGEFSLLYCTAEIFTWYAHLHTLYQYVVGKILQFYPADQPSEQEAILWQDCAYIIWRC